MKICIFYSWQSDYEDDCKKFIGKALEKANNELNKEQNRFEYYIVRGGGGLVGSQKVDEQIDNVLKYEAGIVVSDFTHVGSQPEKDKDGKWIKTRALPNPNVIEETTKAKERIGVTQIIKVNNTFYGDYKENIDIHFDIQNERFPLAYSFHKVDDETIKPYDTEEFRRLKNALKNSIQECTEEFLKNQKIRFNPLAPLMDIYKCKMFKAPFFQAGKFNEIKAKIESGKSFRLLALPGLGKTRMVCEVFRNVDMNLYYCDCKDNNIGVIRDAIGKLLDSTKDKQIIVVDNCEQRAHSTFLEETYNHDTECQLITLYYNVREIEDTDVDVIRITSKETSDIISFLLNNVEGLADADRRTIIDIAGGFPLMVNKLIEQYNKTGEIASVSQAELFNRMLNINEQNADDLEKKKVMTAFSIFKFIGLWGHQEKQGRFVSENSILTPLVERNANDRFMRFQNVYAEFSKGDLLDREGNVVLMRPIPLAIYLAKNWYQQQTTETISMLIGQINALKDQGTKNILIESLSRRITLLADVPLAQELVRNLLNPQNSPFLSEEVVLTKLGSRLFLAFSEVNPEACADALYHIVKTKDDSEIIAIEEARRNLAWALDHLAFDRRSFKNAMLTLAKFSLAETEDISNNTTGLFVERFPILLPATEVPLMERLEVICELLKEDRYKEILRKALLMGLNINHSHRICGAEKQGMKSLTDYVPDTYGEVLDYFSNCLKLLLSITDNDEDVKEIGKTVSNCARGYYLQGFESFLFEAIEALAPMYNYDWEEMKEALNFIIKYDAPRRSNHCIEKINEIKKKFIKDDYVYRLLHSHKDYNIDDRLSFEEKHKQDIATYEGFAHELIDNKLYKDSMLMSSILNGECFYYNAYGISLSLYSKEVGIQRELLNIILDIVLNQAVSKDGESLLIYFMMKVEDNGLLDETYDTILHSDKKRLLPAIYAIKGEGNDRLAQLFQLLDSSDLRIPDFTEYFTHLTLDNFDVKYVANRLVDYGAEGAEIVLRYCHNLLFDDSASDELFQTIGRKCLMLINLEGIKTDDYLYMQCMNNYLVKHRDEKMALRVQQLQEKSREEYHLRNSYYLDLLYRKVLQSYPDLLKSRIFELLEDKDVRHSWIDLMRTSYPQEPGSEAPVYTLISEEDWFNWLDGATDNDRAYSLAMMFSYAENGSASMTMIKLIDGYWCDEIKDAISSRMHSFEWSGSGIPLYRSRIAICEDYVAKLTNEDAKKWFEKDIEYWEKEIKDEILQHAHERALYD